MFDFVFFLNSALLGAALAMDAFSVSLSNGLAEPKMKKGKTFLIAGTFAFFQALMPLIGWTLVHTAVEAFSGFSKAIPYVAFAILSFIGGKMIFDGIKNKTSDGETAILDFKSLFLQGIATSIDALSVGFAISSYSVYGALVAALIISAVTFILCLAALFVGKKIGAKLSGKATIFGGAILILIGVEILIKGVLGF
ncbi:MAG TPA: hypothetical protein DDW54_04030 [Clostridiales bacterium]|nr:hypothetical protein [Clostridiales bacterium]